MIPRGLHGVSMHESGCVIGSICVRGRVPRSHSWAYTSWRPYVRAAIEQANGRRLPTVLLVGSPLAGGQRAAEGSVAR